MLISMFMSPGKYTEEDRLFAGQECVPTPPRRRRPMRDLRARPRARPAAPESSK